jgi:hypothetical protein
MARKVRGLDLSRVDVVSEEELRENRDFYTKTLGHTHSGLDFWLDNGVETLKRYRAFSDAATPGNYESGRRLFVFGFLPYYALIGYDVGVRYLIHTRQTLGMTREHILEGVAMAFLVVGPAGMETIARALKDYQWLEPEQPAAFPEGWAPDPDAFRSGLDFTTSEMLPGEPELLTAWYERTLGEVPRYVRMLLRDRPDMLKTIRGRYEHCLRVLPKQMMPTTMLHYEVIRGFDDGIRENLLLARAFGVTKDIVLNVIGSATINGGTAGLSIIERAGGDVLAAWS